MLVCVYTCKIPHCWKSQVIAHIHQFMKVLDMLTFCMLGNGACLFVATVDLFISCFKLRKKTNIRNRYN